MSALPVLDPKAECHSCVHKETNAFSHHIRCLKPAAGVRGNPHGVRNGWFFYPLLFDPVWKLNHCENFTPGANT